jgi:hypothetical protein
VRFLDYSRVRQEKRFQVAALDLEGVLGAAANVPRSAARSAAHVRARLGAGEQQGGNGGDPAGEHRCGDF